MWGDEFVNLTLIILVFWYHIYSTLKNEMVDKIKVLYYSAL